MNFNISTNSSSLIQKAVSIETYVYLTSVVLPNISLVCFIFGVIGFIGNAFTFLQPELRYNSCCIYTLCSSVVDLIHLTVNIFPSYLQTEYNIILPWSSSDSLCKFYYFLYNFLPLLATNLLLMSMIDRYACSCALTSWIFGLNGLKMVVRMIFMMISISCIFATYAPILGTTEPLFCGYRQEKIYGILSVLIHGIIQPIVMLTFVLLTYRNIRQSRRRVGAGNQRNGNRYRNQFVVMIITQILVTAVLVLQWTVIQSFVLFVEDNITTTDDLITLALLLDFSNRIYPFNNVKFFYFSVLTSKSYRNTLVKGLKRLVSRQWCH